MSRMEFGTTRIFMVSMCDLEDYRVTHFFYDTTARHRSFSRPWNKQEFS